MRLFKVSRLVLTGVAEADKLLADLPQWTSVLSIKEEVERRFGQSDKDDMDDRLKRCEEFERRWESDRQDFTQRLKTLRALFERKMNHAVAMFSEEQAIADEI